MDRKSWPVFFKDIDPRRLVFLDETGVKTNFCPLYGWSKKGERCIGHAPGKWETQTIISAIRVDGVLDALLIDGTLNKPTFKYYMEDILLPELKEGDIVILDNLNVHYNSFDIKKFEKKNIIIKYLPKYSPDLNPIEKMWSKFKSIFRKLQARTKEALYDAMNHARWAVTPENLKGWFESCGYSH